MKRYLINLFVILCATLSVGLTSARAGQAFIGPVIIQMVDVVGVSWGAQTAGNVEVKIPVGSLPAGLSCSDQQILSTKASDMNSTEIALLMLARQTGALQMYLWISDDAAHNAVPGRCSIYAINF